VRGRVEGLDRRLRLHRDFHRQSNSE
jgi:hypothetical protein